MMYVVTLLFKQNVDLKAQTLHNYLYYYVIGPY